MRKPKSKYCPQCSKIAGMPTHVLVDSGRGHNVNCIDCFDGEYRFLSNFYPSEVTAEWNEDRVKVKTVEHAFQAAKAMRRADFDAICAAPTPGRAKRLGREIMLRPGWDAVKHDVMEKLVREKFQDPKLREKLLATRADAELIEGNTWGDVYWGAVATSDGQWEGENHLGKILMKVRQELRAVSI